MSSPTLSQTPQPPPSVHRDALGTCHLSGLAPGSFKIHIVRMMSLLAGGTGIGFAMALNRGSQPGKRDRQALFGRTWVWGSVLVVVSLVSGRWKRCLVPLTNAVGIVAAVNNKALRLEHEAPSRHRRRWHCFWFGDLFGKSRAGLEGAETMRPVLCGLLAPSPMVWWGTAAVPRSSTIWNQP